MSRLTPVRISLGPSIDVVATPIEQGDQVGVSLVAHTPQGPVSMQATATRKAWQEMLAYGKAKVGPLLDRWFHHLASRYGLSTPPHRGRRVLGGQGASVGGIWNNGWLEGQNNGWNPPHHFWGGNNAWTQPNMGPYLMGGDYHYYPLFPLYPINTLPPAQGFLYPPGLATHPGNPAAWNSRRYQSSYPPFSSAWMDNTAFCLPGQCGI